MAFVTEINFPIYPKNTIDPDFRLEFEISGELCNTEEPETMDLNVSVEQCPVNLSEVLGGSFYFDGDLIVIDNDTINRIAYSVETAKEMLLIAANRTNKFFE